MLRLHSMLMVMVAVLFVSATAKADSILVAEIANSEEISPTASASSFEARTPERLGLTTFLLNTSLTALTFTAAIFNFDDTHIHAAPAVTPISIISGDSDLLEANDTLNEQLPNILAGPANIDVQIGGESRVTTANPEPSTFVIFGTGIVGLLAFGWRRMRTISGEHRE